MIGTWAIQNDYTASANQFRRSSAANAVARFPFTGEGVRLRYGRHELACAFDVEIDGDLVETLNGYSTDEGWGMAGPYFLPNGYHVLDIRSRADVSNACGVDIDYVEVFSGPPAPSAPDWIHRRQRTGCRIGAAAGCGGNCAAVRAADGQAHAHAAAVRGGDTGGHGGV